MRFGLAYNATGSTNVCLEVAWGGRGWSAEDGLKFGQAWLERAVQRGAQDVWRGLGGKKKAFRP